MGESYRQTHHHLYGHQLVHPAPPAHHGRPPVHHSRLGGVRGAGGGGEIVEVQGGHILRSIGRKDRHSKVFTAKGPRDRRVRLSAHTAIQFYDVQDRLGYDRPSKAVDWLIKNAKAAIDELAELPACRPMATATAAAGPLRESEQEDQEGEAAGAGEESGEKPLPEEEAVASSTYGFATSSFLPPSLDSDAIADTIKSFFPMAAATTGPSSSPAGGFQSYPPEFLSRGGSQAQDLRLSLQSFQDPVLLQQQQQQHHHHPQPSTTHHRHHSTSPAAEQALFSSSSTHLPFEGSSAGWSELSQRMFLWNTSAETGGGGGGGGGSAGGYILVPPQQQAVPQHPVLGQSPFLSQRGPLQSSNSPHVRAWADPSAADEAAALPVGFAPGGLSGFRIPARIQGEEEHDGMHKKPSSASSGSRH